MLRTKCTALAALAAAGACGHPAPPAPKQWPVPPGWKHEVIPFPLEFAPALAHRGVEELRFPPGFMKVGDPDAWSYMFVWRLEDPADLGATALAGELQGYFRGLLAAVDGDKHRLDPAQITVTVTGSGWFDVEAHIIDTFHDAQAVELVGRAGRVACGGGSLWKVALWPAGADHSTVLMRGLEAAACGQRPVD